MVGLDRDPAVKPFRQVGEQYPPGLHELHVGDSPPGLRVAGVGEEPHALPFDERGAVRALESGQVGDVDRAGHEQRLDERRAQPVDPGAQEIRGAHGDPLDHASIPTASRMIAPWRICW